MKKVVIIGGMAAGCKTAARLKRLKPDFDITIIEKQDFLSYGTCGMPFYASGDIDDFFDLNKTPYGLVRDTNYFFKSKKINIKLSCEAIDIDKDKQIVKCLDLKTQQEFTLPYDYIVFATGATPVKPNFPIPNNENISDFHNPINAKKFKLKAQTGQIGSVAIIGGGFIGVELAEAMVSLWGIQTHLIELTNRLMPQALDKELSYILEKHLQKEDINIYLNTTVAKIEENNDNSLKVIFCNNDEISVDYVFLCLGIKPNLTLSNKIGVEQGYLCGIKTNEKLQTNIKNIYAAGDCILVKDLITDKEAIYPFGSLANREGRVVADAIAGLNSKFKGAIGTCSIKVFELIVASAGLSEHQAQLLGYNFDCVWGTFYDRPDYMPETQILFAKLIYEKQTLRLLGLKLIGKGEVTRYIDTFSVLASEKKTAYDLTDFEHAYTPTHSSPINPLNHLGAMAINQEIDGIQALNPLKFQDFNGFIVDIREESEIKEIPIENANLVVSILDYHQKINEIPKDKEILIICQKGPRSYEVARTLKNYGYNNVKYLAGGVQFAKAIF